METISGGGGRTTDAEDITEGTFTLARLPTMDDDHIPDLETLSYGGTFAEAQIPDLPTVKITSGTFDSDRIPILPTDRYGSAVLLTGDQTIGGTKTFGDIPILPASDPTSDNEAARKAYVDAQGGGIGTHANEYHDPDMLCTNGSNAMAGTLNMGSHPIHAADELSFDHDAKFYSSTDYEVELRTKDNAYCAGLRMGHLKSVYNIDTYGTLDMHGHPVINVPTPTSGNHAANKTYVDAAKQFWVPVTFGDPASADLTHYGNYPVCHLTLTNYAAYMSFNVPDDFHSITEAKVAVIPRNTHAAAAWSVSSHYGAVGESYLQHSGGVAITYSVSNGVLFEVDISGILTSLAAGDYVGIRFYKRDDWVYVDVLGVMFKYT